MGSRARKTARRMPAVTLPTALTVIRAIALAGGKLKGSEYYLTKYQMIGLCQRWLKLRHTGR